MSATSTLRDWGMALLNILLWPFRQFWAALGNIYRWITERLSLREVVLPAIYDSALWVASQVGLALGFGKPNRQVEASFVLSIATFVTGIVTGGLAWVLIAVWIVTFLVGFARFVPFVNRIWPLDASMLWYDPESVDSLLDVLVPG